MSSAHLEEPMDLVLLIRCPMTPKTVASPYEYHITVQ